jgi:DNA-directed RNA polymerase subunit E'/Rpb7
MSKISIQKNIMVEPEYLNSNIKKHIYDKLCKELDSKDCYCNQDNGYVTKIYDDVSLINNTVSNTGSEVIFTVKVSIKTLKPEIGKTYKATVSIVSPNAIFTHIENKVKILVPPELTSYKYDKNSNCYKKGDKKISVGSTVQVKITDIKYENNNFNCIASLN